MVEWKDVKDPKWAAEVELWAWESRRTDEWEKSGTCPRCKHHMSVLAQGGTLVGGATMTVDAAPDLVGGATMTVDAAPDPVDARCNQCEHDGHPTEPAIRTRGCGARGQISPP
jgi:Zn finger protein HypA/HybF involved in hydrogenase expression